ncbi:MAG: polyprenyl synthetase family protein [Alphaproteobacteria bacterium]|jgi:octaprenyl-diphosphate synthase|nr:polyprenyl synthetase family protein [Alphaproteobacteria bacterium]MBT5390158.1 polyprenyl synthetase family protein [Alphaproteobacteria bacterium]MBT5654185.1 polyprenyl synthetase family protein [Alphaproteobacteria bacterium]
MSNQALETPSPSPLEKAHVSLENEIQSVNSLIEERLQSPVPLIPNLSQHIINAGGKRLRPILTLLCAKLCGYEGTRHINLATCIEFIHTATLLHDDVVDKSLMRRGIKTANALWGNKASVLVGDFLFSRAFECMIQDGSQKVLEILSKTASTIAEGEVLQLSTAKNIHTNQETYLKVISSKTAALFSAACQIGAIIADRSEKEVNALAAYGEFLGIAFQLTDDVLDYTTDLKVLGKSTGDDFQEGKVTLPVILAYETASSEEKTFLENQFKNPSSHKEHFSTTMHCLEKHRAFAITMSLAESYAKKAIQSLAIFTKQREKATLEDMAKFSSQRHY